MSALLLVVAAFLASAVEAVEALTIVLAVGVTRGWRSTLSGVAVALAVLAGIVAVLGPALTALPISTLRVFVGGLLLVFGLQWLRKAILRSSGLKALHDEDAIFREQAEHARAIGGREPAGIDWYSFTIAFKGVLLEGLEVAFIVVTFGSNQGSIPLAAAGAAAAHRRRRGGRRGGARPALAGAREHAQVRRRPAARDLRDVLGSRGRGSRLAGVGSVDPGPARLLSGREPCARAPPDPEGPCRPQARGGRRMSRLVGFARFLYEFVVGDDITIAVGVVAALALTAAFPNAGGGAFWIVPAVVVALLGVSVARVARKG